MLRGNAPENRVRCTRSNIWMHVALTDQMEQGLQFFLCRFKRLVEKATPWRRARVPAALWSGVRETLVLCTFTVCPRNRVIRVFDICALCSRHRDIRVFDVCALFPRIRGIRPPLWRKHLVRRRRAGSHQVCESPFRMGQCDPLQEGDFPLERALLVMPTDSALVQPLH